ncbi:MAG TPA: biotin carboxylase N-terminal domain-containing protein [Vicinamibacterales bacterium]|nr:biotin carboxylase N-terminal domain-containing protein [Vicinamibacterales bacterium]
MKKILIANRGEIAVRIIRTCRDMGIAAVAVYSECDRTALHVRLADEAYAIGPDQASESYLRVDKMIDAAGRAGADAVHPGYGFLAENPEFAEACAKAGLIVIGPSADAMRALGSKTAAREIAVRAGVPIVPGSSGPLSSGDGPGADAERAAAAAAIGYPLLVKAVAGGGGKGMRLVRTAGDLAAAVRLARSEGASSFGDGRVYFERWLDAPRHIEVQLLGDRYGTIVPFVERECSIQRRHQKLIEETPSSAVTPALREQLTAAAAAIGRAAAYTSAGTIEFLVDASGRFYFLEMNTRLQVEHPITEAVTGVDFVRAQIEIARGARLDAIVAGLKSHPTEIAGLKSRPTEVGRDFSRADGHAIEVRVYAEDPDQGFLPSPGLITHLSAPGGPGIRDDSGAYEGWTVPTAYDPLISKVIAWAPDRPGAIARMVRALREYDVRGISTTIGFCHELIESPAFAAGDFDTTTVDRMLEQRSSTSMEGDDRMEEMAAIAAALWEMVRLKPDPTNNAGPTNKVDAAATSPWEQRARLESLR